MGLSNLFRHQPEEISVENHKVATRLLRLHFLYVATLFLGRHIHCSTVVN
jgi:hypothetical protein